VVIALKVHDFHADLVRLFTVESEKLPHYEAPVWVVWEHPILENSTACTCQMPNNLVPASAG